MRALLCDDPIETHLVRFGGNLGQFLRGVRQSNDGQEACLQSSSKRLKDECLVFRNVIVSISNPTHDL